MHFVCGPSAHVSSQASLSPIGGMDHAWLPVAATSKSRAVPTGSCIKWGCEGILKQSNVLNAQTNSPHKHKLASFHFLFFSLSHLGQCTWSSCGNTGVASVLTRAGAAQKSPPMGIRIDEKVPSPVMLPHSIELLLARGVRIVVDFLRLT